MTALLATPAAGTVRRADRAPAPDLTRGAMLPVHRAGQRGQLRLRRPARPGRHAVRKAFAGVAAGLSAAATLPGRSPGAATSGRAGCTSASPRWPPGRTWSGSPCASRPDGVAGWPSTPRSADCWSPSTSPSTCSAAAATSGRPGPCSASPPSSAPTRWWSAARPAGGSASWPRGSPRSAGPADHPDALRITVTDDGIGGADPAHGSGLRGIADRLEAADGRLEVSSPLAGPTLVTITIPREGRP